MKLNILIVFLLLLTGCAVSDNKKKEFTIKVERLPRLPKAVGGAALVKNCDSLLIEGGTGWIGNQKFWSKESYLFRPSQHIWQKVANLPTPLGLPVSVKFKGLTLLIGGEDGQKALDTVLALDKDCQGNWRNIGRTPFKLTYAAGAANQEYIYIVGGTEKVSDYGNGKKPFWLGQTESNGEIFWKRGPNFPGKANNLMASTCWQGKFYVFGGYYTENGAALDSNEVYSYTEENGWKREAGLPSPARCLTCVNIPEIGIILLGKWGENLPTGVFLFRPNQNEYTKLGDLPVSASVISGLYDGKYLYLAGGEDKARHRIDSFFRLTVHRKK